MQTFSINPNPRKQGDAGMGVAISWFTRNNFTVCIPLTDSQDYDLVVDNGNGLKRVSVKSIAQKPGSANQYSIDLRTRGGNHTQAAKVKHFDPSAVDYLFVACSDGRSFLVPSCDITSRSYFTVGGRRGDLYLCG